MLLRCVIRPNNSYVRYLKAMTNQLDIILFGASGFTGTYCIESLHKLTKYNGLNLTWGIAGRSESKLKDALKEYENKIGEDLTFVPVIIADTKDFESLKSMCSRAKVIVNCTGPYRFYGEPVVKACIETGTHHVDVSGEPQYMESIQYKYHQMAKEKGVYIVSACGFDSVPADFGVLLIQSLFEGTVNSVESYLQFSGGDKSSRVNYTTYESAVHGVGAMNELGKLRKKLYPTRLPTFKPKLEARGSIHKSELIHSWCIPFLGSDRSVIQRTQRYLFDNKNTRPVQVHCYLGLQSFYSLIVMVFLGMIFSLLSKYEFGRTLLLKHPALFTAGFVNRNRPNRNSQAKGSFSTEFYASGWSEKLKESTDEFETPPDKKMMLRLSAFNPGYGLTANGVTLAAITILSEKDKLPKGGGVFTPGAAFQDTSFITQLQENGLKVEVLLR